MGRWIEYLNVMKQQWRWWTLLGATLLAAYGLFALQLEFESEERIPLPIAGNDFLLFHERRFGREYLSQWRWKEHRWDRIATINPDTGLAVSHDQRTLFLANEDITIVERLQPHRRVTIPLAGISERSLKGLLAVSDNRRFVVFFRRNDHMSVDLFRNVHRLQVVDLLAKKIVDDRVTSNHATYASDSHYFNVHPSAAAQIPPGDPLPPGRWQLTEEGALRKTATPETRTLYGVLTPKSNGSWQWTERDPATVPRLSWLKPVCEVSPDGVSIVVNEYATSRYFRINLASQEATLIETRHNDSDMRGVFSQDERTLYFFGRRGYSAAVDATTGKVVAEDNWGFGHSVRQWSVVVLVFSLAVVWYVAARCTASILWLNIAIGFIGLFGQWVVVRHSLVAGEQPHRIASAMLLGIAVGTIVALGWLWAWGKGWQHDRWAAGVVALGLIALPVCFYATDWIPGPFTHDPAVLFSPFHLAVTVLKALASTAAVVAALASVPRLLGWKFSLPNEDVPNQFQLGEMFVVIGGLSIAIVWTQAAWTSASDDIQRRAIAAGILLLVIALTATLLATFQRRWTSFLWIIPALVAAVALSGKLYVTNVLWKGMWGPPTMLEQTGIYASFLTTALFLATIPMYCLRRQGWRWMRASARQAEPVTTSTSSAVA